MKLAIGSYGDGDQLISGGQRYENHYEYRSCAVANCQVFHATNARIFSYFILKGRDDLGIGVIWIQHDMQMVAYLTDSIHVLDYGRSLADGHPDEVLKMKKSSKPISAKLE